MKDFKIITCPCKPYVDVYVHFSMSKVIYHSKKNKIKNKIAGKHFTQIGFLLQSPSHLLRWGVNRSEDARHFSVLYICKYFVAPPISGMLK
jgi:hypothetical protein